MNVYGPIIFILFKFSFVPEKCPGARKTKIVAVHEIFECEPHEYTVRQTY